MGRVRFENLIPCFQLSSRLESGQSAMASSFSFPKLLVEALRHPTLTTPTKTNPGFRYSSPWSLGGIGETGQFRGTILCGKE
jgi:hypothetical protein